MNERAGRCVRPDCVQELTAGVRCSVPVLHLLLLPLQLSCFPLQLLLLSHQVGLPSSRRRLDGNKSILLSQFWLSYLFILVSVLVEKTQFFYLCDSPVGSAPQRSAGWRAGTRQQRWGWSFQSSVPVTQIQGHFNETAIHRAVQK